MAEYKEQIKCPYVEKIKSITGKVEFNCEDCPALVCPFPEIKEEREKKYTESENNDG